MDILRGKKRGQVTVFIIIGILVVAGVSLFFILSEDVSLQKRVPAELEPVYKSFQSCVESNTEEGISILERQGGYIYLPEYKRSLEPFSSWFYFSGNSIPYWFYERGGIQNEQVPTKEEMEKDLERYVENQVQRCSFTEYENQGFDVEKGQEAEANVEIDDNNVNVDLDMDFSISKGEISSLVGTHEISVNSRLGSLYDSAIKIYEKEKQEKFLDEYGIDVLRLYAPVDGLELQCSPLVWNAESVFRDFENALETNMNALGSGGRSQNRDPYFNLDLDIENNVRFLNSKNWERSFEVNPSEGNRLVSEPVGENPALGAMGFCYNTYHFVYDMKYPILVQVYDSREGVPVSERETFQFPVGVVIKGNQPRESLNASASDVDSVELCGDRNTNMTISTYDREVEPVDSKVSIECLNTRCYLGETGEDGTLNTQVPQCVNGQIIANAEGFKTSENQYSTVEGGNVEIIMDSLYNLDLDVLIEGKSVRSYTGEDFSRIMVSFNSEDHSQTLLYPEENTVSLTEGQYSIEVFIYGNTSLSLDETDSKEYCVDVSDGIMGDIVPGQRCFQIDSPDLINSNALMGGGKRKHYFDESTLKQTNKISLDVDKFEKPGSFEKLQENYNLIENKQIEISLQ